MKRTNLITVLAATGLICSPAMSKADSSKPAAPATQTKNPDQKICEEEVPLGTRLSVHRVCATRSEWERRRQEDRQAIEKQQAQFPMCGSNEGC